MTMSELTIDPKLVAHLKKDIIAKGGKDIPDLDAMMQAVAFGATMALVALPDQSLAELARQFTVKSQSDLSKAIYIAQPILLRQLVRDGITNFEKTKTQVHQHIDEFSTHVIENQEV